MDRFKSEVRPGCSWLRRPPRPPWGGQIGQISPKGCWSIDLVSAGWSAKHCHCINIFGARCCSGYMATILKTRRHSSWPKVRTFLSAMVTRSSMGA